ncbi:chymotrypsin-like elastase family member 2A isoform X1 [Stegodyphus dumicola]|uniref:chymotrypsin-like elastase family member 2A isoform X1 n=1 Tax=Stegodyphus dumicola TaxID=202533 RepID=UPI0015A8F692|nr:chymotrypsin-like elastase family member 2A isoform X1 [Stegodyphus dumicola]
MAFGLVTFVLAALVAAFSARSINDIVSMDKMMTDPDEELSPRVIGGRDALENEFPWMVALHYQGRFVCSSFLVTPKVLMTAAHCVVFGREPEDPKHYNAYVGTIHRDGPDTEIRFTEIIAHKEYGSGTEYDIALMRLEEPVTLSESVQTICLPTKGSVYEDMTAQVIGWGVQEKGGRESAKILQTAVEKVPTNSMCSFTYAILGIPVTRRHVCAGGESDKGICFGDSGGPLVALNETKPVAIGVASFGSYLGCAAPRVPAVYTATASYTDWIEENMGEDASDLCFVNKTSESSTRWWG